MAKRPTYKTGDRRVLAIRKWWGGIQYYTFNNLTVLSFRFDPDPVDYNIHYLQVRSQCVPLTARNLIPDVIAVEVVSAYAPFEGMQQAVLWKEVTDEDR